MKKMLIALTLVLEFAHYEFGHASVGIHEPNTHSPVRRNPDGTGHRMVIYRQCQERIRSRNASVGNVPTDATTVRRFCPKSRQGEDLLTTLLRNRK
jgi:hypothetical protein